MLLSAKPGTAPEVWGRLGTGHVESDCARICSVRIDTDLVGAGKRENESGHIETGPTVHVEAERRIIRPYNFDNDLPHRIVREMKCELLTTRAFYRVDGVLTWNRR